MRTTIGMTFLFVFMLSIGIAEASFFSVPYYGGSGQSSFNGFDNANQNYDGFANYNQGFSNNGVVSNQVFTGNSDSFYGNGFFNSNSGNLLQNGQVSLNDGYSFTKGPCATKTVNGNFVGKYNDFTISEEICDNIEGVFFKDNIYSNSINNNLAYNQANAGATVNNNQFTGSGLQNSFDLNANQFGSGNAGYTFGQATSFGKGTQIIFH
tara:strand:+ start:8492 stop:9118 length:627 start_codon:yes stop_codon:yes gene_type:complete